MSGFTTALYLIVLFRFGLLTIIVGWFFDGLLTAFPLTTDPSSWYAGHTFLVLLTAGALASYGLYVSLPGRVIPRDGSLGE